MDMHATKERIMYAAITLFSDLGYEAVSMRDIAAKVGIKAASIYNHYSSKEDILNSIYAYYASNRDLVTPTQDALLKMLETEPVESVFKLMHFSHPEEVRDHMDRAIIIASRRLFGNENEASERFIRKYIFDLIRDKTVALIKRMIELGKIEPIDTELFCSVLTNYTFSAAALNHSSLKTSEEQWKNGVAMLFSLLKKK
jgi:AcrR family transcriptional regulator